MTPGEHLADMNQKLIRFSPKLHHTFLPVEIILFTCNLTRFNVSYYACSLQREGELHHSIMRAAVKCDCAGLSSTFTSTSVISKHTVFQQSPGPSRLEEPNPDTSLAPTRGLTT